MLCYAMCAGHLHWLSAATAVEAEVRMYDVLFTPEKPEEAAAELKAAAGGGGGGGGDGDGDDEEEDDEEAGAAGAAPDWIRLLNPNSLVVVQVQRTASRTL